jgi:outer membrane protein TolC
MQLEAGAAVTRDLIDAESDLTRARLEMVGAVIGIRQARVALDYATGEYAARASR